MRVSEASPAAIAPIHREGRIFVAAAAAITLLLFWIEGELGILGLFATLGVAAFFRDPPRVPPQGDNLVLAPGDGRVAMITHASAPAELGLGDAARLRISIFLSVFDVHVSRIPVAGFVRAIHYRTGKFFNATLDKASVDNERNAVHIATPSGVDVVVVQIAGLIARRIVCDIDEGQTVQTGQRFGIIRFGSRMDIYLPPGTQPLVRLGQVAVGGETVLARLEAEGL